MSGVCRTRLSLVGWPSDIFFYFFLFGTVKSVWSEYGDGEKKREMEGQRMDAGHKVQSAVVAYSGMLYCSYSVANCSISTVFLCMKSVV